MLEPDEAEDGRMKLTGVAAAAECMFGVSCWLWLKVGSLVVLGLRVWIRGRV